MSEPKTLAYRPHLDGLRAIAVLLVFLFHALPRHVTGGFIGVDVFFVLSGYLITRLLLTQPYAPWKKTLGSFYERRLRRLLPASILVVLAVLLHDSIWGDLLYIDQRIDQIRSVLLYFANWRLVLTSDNYFAESAINAPLRHMWSLAVEEQFYVFWPIVVLLAARARGMGRRRGLLQVVIVVGILLSSVAMAVLFTIESTSRAYYGSDTRVHQLLVGALLGTLLEWHGNRFTMFAARLGDRVMDLLGLGSLLLLLVGSLRIEGTSAQYFRGGALGVALLAALLIWSIEQRQKGWLARLLSRRPFVLLGLISYGFYLWHWPVLVWIQSPVGAGLRERIALLFLQFGLTVGVATASYHLIERPIRGSRPARLLTTFVWSGLVAGLILAFAEPVLIPSEKMLAIRAVRDGSVTACTKAPCVLFDPPEGALRTVAIVGDSTAQQYAPALRVLAEKYGFRLVQGAEGGCPIGHRFLATGENGSRHKKANYVCFEQTPTIYKELLERWNPDLILATSVNEMSRHEGEGGVLVQSGSGRHLAETQEALKRAAIELTSGGASLVFLEILPPGPGVGCLKSGGAEEVNCRLHAEKSGQRENYNNLFAKVATEVPQVSGPIPMTDVVCPQGVCPLLLGDLVVRYDGRHFTGAFSRSLAPILDARIPALKAGRLNRLFSN